MNVFRNQSHHTKQASRSYKIRRLKNPALRCPFDTNAYVIDKRYTGPHTRAL